MRTITRSPKNCKTFSQNLHDFFYYSDIRFPHIRSLRALYQALVGGRSDSAAQMFAYLVNTVDREVSMSVYNWAETLGLSEHQIDRAVARLKQGGLVRIKRRQRRDGAVVNHYRIDLETLIQRLADFCGLPPEQVRDYLLSGLAAEPSGGSSPAQGGENRAPTRAARAGASQESLSFESSPEKDLTPEKRQENNKTVFKNNPVFTALEELKKIPDLSDQTARYLTRQFGAWRARDAAIYAQKHGTINPAGMVVASLREGWDFSKPPPGQKSPPAPREGAYRDPDGTRYIDGPFKDFIYSGLKGRGNADDFEDEPPDEPPPVQGPITLAEHQWNIAYGQLGLQLDRHSYSTFVQPVMLRRVEPNGAFVLAVKNPYAQQYLQHRLYREIRRVLGDVIGYYPDLIFELA